MKAVIFLCVFFIVQQLVKATSNELLTLLDGNTNALMSSEEFSEYIKNQILLSYDYHQAEVVKEYPEYDSILSDMKVEFSRLMNESLLANEICSDGAYCHDNKVILYGIPFACKICTTITDLLKKKTVTSLDALSKLACGSLPIPFCSFFVGKFLKFVGGSIEKLLGNLNICKARWICG